MTTTQIKSMTIYDAYERALELIDELEYIASHDDDWFTRRAVKEANLPDINDFIWTNHAELKAERDALPQV